MTGEGAGEKRRQRVYDEAEVESLFQLRGLRAGGHPPSGARSGDVLAAAMVG